MKTAIGLLVLLLGIGGTGYIIGEWDGVRFIYGLLFWICVIIVGIGLLTP